MKVAIYARVSTKDQNCARQLSDLDAWAVRMGWQVVLVAHERMSGTKTDRIERRKVLDAAKAGLIQAVIVTEPSRWSRSLADLISSLEQLTASNCSLLTLQGLNVNLSSPEGRLMITILGAFAEFERELIAERVRSGVAAAKARGVRFGRERGDRPTDKLKAAVASAYAQQSSLRKTAKLVGCSVNTVRRLLS